MTGDGDWRDEFRRQPLGEMTPGEFFGSLLVVVFCLIMLLALLWIAPPSESHMVPKEGQHESR